MQFGKIVVNIILALSVMVKSHPIRQKRSLQYFFDGLVNGYNEKRKSSYTSRNLFDFASPLSTLAKLSTVSMQTKTEPIDDHIEMESQLVDDRRKSNLPQNRSTPVIDNDLLTSNNSKTNTTSLKKSRKSMQSKNVTSHVNASLDTPTSESKDETVVSSVQSTTDEFTTHAMTTPVTPIDGTKIATPTETNTVLRKTIKIESENCCNPLIDTVNEKTEISPKLSAVIFLIPLATEQMDEHENKDCKEKRPQSLSLYDDASKFLIAIDLHTNIDQTSSKEMKIRHNKLLTLHGLPIVHLI